MTNRSFPRGSDNDECAGARQSDIWPPPPSQSSAEPMVTHKQKSRIAWYVCAIPTAPLTAYAVWDVVWMNQHTDAADPPLMWVGIIAVVAAVSWGVAKIIELTTLMRR